jgi:hypothetical protein
LLRGHLPENEWAPVSGKKDVYKLKEDFNCLAYYRYASMSRRVKKIPFFTYWFILKQQGFLTLGKINDALNPEFRLEARWIDEAREIIVRLGEDSDFAEIKERLRKVHDDLTDNYRPFIRYQKKGLVRDAIFNLLQENPIGKLRSEILEFIDKHGTPATTWRDMRRLKRNLREIQPEILMWILDDLEKEDLIAINIYPPSRRIYIQSR